MSASAEFPVENSSQRALTARGPSWDEEVNVPLSRIEMAAVWNVLLSCPRERREQLMSEKGPVFAEAYKRALQKLNEAIDSPARERGGA